MNERHLHRGRNITERDEAVGGAELLRERVPVTEPIRRLALRGLEGLDSICVKIIFHCQRLRCTRYAISARSKSFLLKIKSLKH